MSRLTQDIRFAARTLTRHWMITTVAIVSLALAIGGNAAVFSLVDAFLFRPLPYPDADRVVLLEEARKGSSTANPTVLTSLRTYPDLREMSRTIETWAAYVPRGLTIRGSERTEAVSGAEVTPTFFDVLKAEPERGRTFREDEGGEGGAPVAIISREMAVERWGAEHDPLGDVVVIDGRPREIIGILPPGFAVLTAGVDVWLPLERDPFEADRGERNVLTLGRLAPSATMEQVRAEMTSIAGRLEAEHPEAMRGWTIRPYNLREDLPTGQTKILLALLQGSVVLVLLIACVNLTNLLMAKGRERAGEIAMRAVLGAGRWRIVRQLLTESGVMVAVGAVIGLGLGALGIEALARNFAGALPANFEPRMDGNVLLFTAGVSVLAGLAFGLAPALQVLKTDHASTLRKGGGGGGSGPGSTWLTRSLVIAEIALSFVALGGGSLLIRSFLDIRGGDPGFEAESLLTATVRVPRGSYPAAEERLRLAEQLLEEAGRLPGVRSVALVSSLPQGVTTSTDTFRIAGAPVDPGLEPPTLFTVIASPGYGETFELEILRGRFLERSDRLDDDPVVVVNETLAREHFGQGSPLGERLVLRGKDRRIVGVVADIDQTLFQVGPTTSTEKTAYIPLGQSPAGASTLALRTAGEPRAVADPLRDAVQRLDPDLALSNVLTMEEYVEQFFVGVRVFNVILGGFGIVALLLAALGTYGVLAYTVSQRRREIGVRMAIGAGPGKVVMMIARQGIVLGVIGLAIGTLLTLPMIGLIQRLLQGLSTVQPMTLVLIGALLLGVTVLASIIPAVRATSIHPARTLNQG